MLINRSPPHECRKLPGNVHTETRRAEQCCAHIKPQITLLKYGSQPLRAIGGTYHMILRTITKLYAFICKPFKIIEMISFSHRNACKAKPSGRGAALRPGPINL